MTEQVDASRESLWDAMRAFATVRVVAWHTWRWAPLSWVAAMPAMFFTAGVLLEGSVERHGWTSTLRTRLRRLLVPFWVYSATSVVIMLALGWRPGFGDVWQWVIPLGDPVGSSEAPSLWIPLWYLRAYLWFVVAAGVLSWLVRRLGWWTVGLLAVCAGLQQLWWSSAPLAVSDGVVYAVFVSAGMVVSVLGVPRRAIVVPIAVGATVATAAAMVSGLASTVVNESHVVTAIAGVATVGALLAVAGPIRRFATGAGAGVVGWLGRRALSVYLWQGLGLFVADRLVARQGVEGVTGVVASGVIVAVVTIAMAVLMGPVEDFAARRRLVTPSWRRLPGFAVAASLVVVAFVVTPDSGTVATLPLSGQGAVAAGEQLDDPDNTAVVHIDPSVSTSSTVPAPVDTEFDLVEAAARDERIIAFLDSWAVERADEYAELDEDWIDVAVATADGEVAKYRWTVEGGAARVDALDPMPWYSNAKAATGGWLFSLVQQGVVRLDDPVSRYLPEVPHGDEITLEQLARHLSGIPSEADSPDSEELDVGADVRRWMTTGDLVTPPGSTFHYSRVGYSLLAWALERASGVSWQDAMMAMAAEAGADVRIDESEAPADAPNHHPGEGTYRGKYYAAGGLLGTPDAMARFYQWLYGDRLTVTSWEVASSASSRPETAHYGIGSGIDCPCTDDGVLLRGVRVGHATGTGWWRHDRSHRATIVMRFENFSGDYLFAPTFTDESFVAAAWAAVLGP